VPQCWRMDRDSIIHAKLRRFKALLTSSRRAFAWNVEFCLHFWFFTNIFTTVTVLQTILKVRYKKHKMLNLLNDCPQRCFILQQKQNKVRSQVLYSKTFLPISIEKNEIRALHALPPPQALVVSWEGHDFERACGGGSSTLERGDWDWLIRWRQNLNTYGVSSWREQWRRGVSIGFTFLPHVIIPDKRNGVHWSSLTWSSGPNHRIGPDTKPV
jgi:hypothetical protein